MKRLPYITTLLALFAVAIYLVPGATALFEFTRVGTGRQELWRWITGHFTHFGPEHLRWDLAVFVAFGMLGEFNNRRTFLLTIAAATVAIPAAVAVFQPQIESYRGLSGLDSALFGLIMSTELVDGWVRRQSFSVWLSGIACVGFGAKTVYEIVVGQPVFVESSAFSPLPLAHLVGFVVACVVTVVEQMSRPVTTLAGFLKSME